MKVSVAPDFEKALPEHTDAELAQLEKNVLADPQHVLMPPVVIWENHKNTIVDGHHQYRLRTKHRLAIKYLKRKFETRQDAMREAYAIQLGRRNWTASQRAIAAAEMAAFSRGEPTVILQSAAATAGVSEKTAWDAKKVIEECATKVVEAVKAGDVAASDAAAISERPKAEQTAALKKVKSGEAKTLRSAVADKEAVIAEDANGTKLPAKLIAVFAEAGQFAEQRKALAGVKSWAESIGPAVGSYLHVQSFTAAIKGLQNQLKFEAPFAVCPYCSAGKAKCQACKGRGFVTKPIYDAAPAELRV